jgi:YD repeat-containing protein
LTSITPNGTTQTYTYSTTNEINSGTYNVNGSPTALGSASYTWDGANRIATFTSGSTTSTFSYDGLNRIIRVVDTVSGSITADHGFTWCGAIRCLAHDNTQTGSPISTRNYNQGAIVNGTSYYYVRDLLGSVRTLELLPPKLVTPDIFIT